LHWRGIGDRHLRFRTRGRDTGLGIDSAGYGQAYARLLIRPLGDIPIIVLTHEASARGPDETQEQRDAKNKLWIDLHDQIAAMSTRGKRLTVDNAGHYIQMDQPQVVIDTVLEVVRNTDGRKQR